MKKIVLIIILVGMRSAYIQGTDIDVVLVCHEKDKVTLDLAIAGIKKNVKNVRRIITVSAKRLTESAEWFDEALFPFTKRDVAIEIFQNVHKARRYMHMKDNRIGWVYQQLLKFYAIFVIPDVSPNMLVVDADAVFLTPVEFIDAEGYALQAVATEYHKPYFEHGARLIPGFRRVYPEHSGIVHHNFFQRYILEDMFKIIENTHKTETWRAMCHCIDKRHLKGAETSCMAECELYPNFIWDRPYPVKIRPLKWKNVTRVSDIKKAAEEGFDLVACHSWERK